VPADSSTALKTLSEHPDIPRVLVVDDEPDLLTLYELTLLREGLQVDTADSVESARAHLAEQRYDVVITDMRLPDGTGLELMKHLDQEARGEKIIVITAYGSPENAVEALKAGAFDYLTKPVDLRQFRTVVGSAAGRHARAVGAAAAAVSSPLSRLVGASRPMQQVRAMVEKVARSMAPVLIHGESGTGKELVARAIHGTSVRATGPFVAVNCGAIPENLLEAEFFGYRKGAFTGAQEDREGFFQAAAGGTLFLDEIGDLPLAMQSKLLRAIQERAVRPIGATAEQPVDVRVVSATHKDLVVEVAAQRFRQDLYYRLNVIQIVVPPLRERRDDLEAICQAVLTRTARDAGVSSSPALSADARFRLANYTFPGNVRELENILQRALALCGGDTITAEDLGLPAGDMPPAAEPSPTAAPAAVPADPPAPVSASAGGERDGASATHPGAGVATAPERTSPTAAGEVPAPVAAATPTSLPRDLVAYLDDVERGVLLQALDLCGYNRTAAGQRLGLTLRQMRYRMARLGISGSGDNPGDPEDAS